MSINASVPNAPVINESVVDSLISDVDDLDMDPPGTPPPGARFSDLKPEDFDEKDDDEGEEKPKPEEKRAKTSTEPKPKAEEEPKEKPELAKADSSLPKDRGAQDKPYAVKDLPEDKYVKIKIDGQEETVSMRELADGHIRLRTFHSTMKRADTAIKEAESIAASHLQERGVLRKDLNELLDTPANMFKLLMKRNPDTLMELGKLIGAKYKEWAEDPDARRRYDYDRQQAETAAERARLKKERDDWERERTTMTAAEHAKREWTPAYQEVMKELGFPKLNERFEKTARALLRLAKDEAPDGKVSAEDFKDVLRRAYKLEGGTPVAARKPEPAANPPREARAQTNGKKPKKDFSQMSQYARLRDPDYFLE